MIRFLPACLVGIALIAAAPVSANPPPEDALPLIEVLRMLEERDDVAYYDEIEWDSDGYWEVEYYRPDGTKVEVKIDPVTGDPRR
jgi:hypothetical protein